MTTERAKGEASHFKFMPLTLSLETLGGLATPLVLRGTPLPTRRTQVFSTASDNQQSVELHACLGERPMAEDNLTVARVKLEGLDPAPIGKPQIAVTFEVDNSCVVTVTAVDRGTDKKVSVTSEESQSPLSPEVVEQHLHDAELNRTTDQQKRDRAEIKSKAESAMRKAEADLQRRGEQGHLGPDGNKDRLVAELGLAIEANDYDKMRSVTTRIEGSGGDFNDILASVFGSSPTSGLFGTTPRRSASSATKPEPPRSTAPRVSPPKQKAEAQGRTDNSSPTGSQDTLLEDLGAVFGGARFPLDPNLCFVLMPFREDLRPVYDDHIKKVVEAESFAAVRADDIVGTGSITLDIWEKVNRARFLIADLTGKNPNVFYEVGLAHALGKDVILLTQTMDDVPFDLKGLRCLLYSFTPRGMKALEEKLRMTIHQIMQKA